MHIVTMPVGKGAEEEQMHPQGMVRQVSRLGLLLTLVVLALVACEADEWQQESKPRPLPEDPIALRPDEYRSEEFEPSLSFRVGEGWTNPPLEASDNLSLKWEETGGEATGALSFANVQEVYKPTKTGTPNVVEAPKDMVGWFQHHPYLQTDKPEPVTVGGVKGVQFDVVVEDLRRRSTPVCVAGVSAPGHCVDLFRLSSRLPGGLIAVYEEDKVRIIVLEDVKGEVVTIGFGSPAAEFDEFALEAQRVLDSVQWGGS
jgi:hypothetical protein